MENQDKNPRNIDANNIVNENIKKNEDKQPPFLEDELEINQVLEPEVKIKIQKAYKRFMDGEQVVSIKEWCQQTPYNLSTHDIRKWLNKYDFPIMSLYKDAWAFVKDLEEAYKLIIKDKLTEGFGSRLQRKTNKRKEKEQ